MDERHADRTAWQFNLRVMLAIIAAAAAAGATLPHFDEFVASWRLFHWSYLEGWLIALVLPLVGVIVVARDQIFIGAAVSQASTLGIALALFIAGLAPSHGHPVTETHSDFWLHSDSFQSTMGVLFAVLAAVVTVRGGAAQRESHEAITGWVFLVSASLSVLLLAHSPHGLEEIHRVHSSSIIGATANDVWAFAALAATTAAFVAVAHRHLILFALDPSMAAAVGMNIARWSALVTFWLGLTVGLSIRCSGMLYTFGTLVLPALVAKNLCRQVRPMFLVAPATALLAALMGFVLANHHDFPPAQMTVALLAVLLAVAWTVRRLRSHS